MSQLEFGVKLFDTTAKAADGSNIPRRSCEAYIASPDYQVLIRDRVGLGGLTHKDRKLGADLKGLVGMDDKTLINKNALFYITSLYFKPGDNFLYATAETFDPSLFSGELADNIQNLQGLISSGVRMPVSVVIQALWSRQGVAEKIIRIKGFDFTMNPSFKGAGDLQLFSEVISDSTEIPDDDQRQFSESIANGDLIMQTRVYSSTGEVYVLDDISDDALSNIQSLFSNCQEIAYSDVVGKFGQFSKEADLLRPYHGRHITKSDLDHFKSDDQLRTVDPILKDTITSLQHDTAVGDRDNLQSLFRQNRAKLPNIIRSVPKDDPNYSEMTSHRFDEYFRTTPNDDKTFSLIPSITARILTEDQPRYIKIDRILKAYRTYQLQNNLSELKLDELKNLFVQDINYLIKAVLPEIIKGRDFNSLYGFNRFDKRIGKASEKLSITYRKLLLSEKVMKFIPKGVYNDWKRDLLYFYNELSMYEFNSPLTIDINILDNKL